MSVAGAAALGFLADAYTEMGTKSMVNSRGNTASPANTDACKNGNRKRTRRGRPPARLASLHGGIHAAGCAAAAAVADRYRDGVAAGSRGAREPLHLRAGPLDAPSGCRPRVLHRIAVGIGSPRHDHDRVVRPGYDGLLVRPAGCDRRVVRGFRRARRQMRPSELRDEPIAVIGLFEVQHVAIANINREASPRIETHTRN